MDGGERPIVLFDLDLTLLRIPADRDIRARALDRATGVPGLLERVDDRGRTDRWLVDELTRLRLCDPAGLWERYEAAYVRELRTALAALPSSALPGAARLLEVLRGVATIGVSTGNLRHNAEAKLEHAGLAWAFEPLRGGFGDAHADRADIVHEGACVCGHQEGRRLVVVGDTVHDVRAALDANATPVAVATGHATGEELRAAGAATVLPDLTDTNAALEAILA